MVLRVSLDWLRDDGLEMWVSVTLLSCVTLIGAALAGLLLAYL